jgi:hypothetical protein
MEELQASSFSPSQSFNYFLVTFLSAFITNLANLSAILLAVLGQQTKSLRRLAFSMLSWSLIC